MQKTPALILVITNNILSSFKFYFISLFFAVILCAVLIFAYLMYGSISTTSFTFSNDQGSLAAPYQFESLYQSLLNEERSSLDNGIVGGVIFHGSRKNKEVALTFDADMTEGMLTMLKEGRVKSFYDKSLIKLLENTNTKATLFLTGLWIEKYPAETKKIASNQLFEIGSHSYAHKSFNGYCYGLGQLANKDKNSDIRTAKMLIKKYTGKESKLFRFPGGCYSKNDVLLVNNNGEKVIQWDTVANDGFNSNQRVIENNILNRVKNGSIIVMHMNGYPNEPENDIVVPKIIKILKARGYKFVTVSQLMKDSINQASTKTNYSPLFVMESINR